MEIIGQNGNDGEHYDIEVNEPQEVKPDQTGYQLEGNIERVLQKGPRLWRILLKDGSDYFGPYTSMHLVKTLLEFAKQVYPLRTCNYALTEENIQKEKFKVCLEYHIGNCKAPCVNLQTEEDYQTGIQHIRKILNGDIRSVIKHLQALMQKFAQEMAFEQAQMVKEKIELLENYQARVA